MGALFSTFGINVPLLITQAVNFAITLLVLWFFLWKPLMKALNERQAKIAKGVEDAAAAAKERAETERQRSEVITAAESEAENIVGRATEEGKAESRTIVKRAQERAEATLKEAEAEAEEARRQALRASEKEIATTAILAAEKILREKTS